MKYIFLLSILTLMLLSCSLPPSGSDMPAALQPAAYAAGPTGIKEIHVSDGVILLTPGQPIQVSHSGSLGIGTALGASSTQVPPGNRPSTVGSTPVPTIDLASVELPKGVSIYPGAADLEISQGDPSGMGMKYIIFYTGDTADKVLAYYEQKNQEAGWAPFEITPTPDPSGKRSLIWSLEGVFLTIEVSPTADMRTKVMLVWFKL